VSEWNKSRLLGGIPISAASGVFVRQLPTHLACRPTADGQAAGMAEPGGHSELNSATLTATHAIVPPVAKCNQRKHSDQVCQPAGIVQPFDSHWHHHARQLNLLVEAVTGCNWIPMKHHSQNSAPQNTHRSLTAAALASLQRYFRAGYSCP
jgi:hypothetical protein